MGRRIHFVGVGGSGMSALAQFAAMGGDEATGSDRLEDGAGLGETRGLLESAGVRLFPQDGSGVSRGVSRVVVSTAIEEGNPDLARARELGVPVSHRADFLAELVAASRAVAVAGTSGKSTVAAMTFEVLRAAGRSPSLIAGAALASLRAQGLLGNAFRGGSDLLVIEADESDGTLPKYRPWLGVLLNAGKDHKEVAEILDLFGAFKRNCRRLAANADSPALAGLLPGAATFGFEDGGLRAEGLELGPRGSRFRARGAEFEVPVPGRHNAENALAAAAAALECGVALEDSARALKAFAGISRRFERVGSARGAEVIDDYAHNPDKVRAAIATARLRGRRVLAVFQPHGFAPTRFLKDAFIEAFASALGPGDRLWLPDIYYAGGTAVRDISSGDIARPVAARGRRAAHVPRREDIAAEIGREAGEGDVVLVMGARDPSLGDFARQVLKAIEAPRR